ncbi:APC family permease [Candidatus Bathyarchaeota archaeon]|nr:APC family permease [Candidatus Bathyarchaeota archaeon]
MSEFKPSLFAREATGLVREIGFALGVIIIMSHVIGLGWQKRAFQFTGPRPVPTDMLPLGLPAIFWAFLICGIIVIITGYAAGYVTAAMPRSGGGYVTISRVIHPVVGYMAGWLMFLAEAFSYGLIGVAVFEAIMIFYSIALAPAVVAFSSTTLFVGGLVVIWIFAFLALLGTKLYGRLMEAIFYIPAVITVGFFAMWITGAMNPGILASGVREVMGASPEAFVDLAFKTGMTENISTFYDAFTFALGGAFWAYMGWYSTTFVAGEVKEANKKLPAIVASAGVLIMVVYLAASSLSAVPALSLAVKTDAAGHKWSFFQAYSWLSYAGVPSETIKAVIPNFQSAWSTGIASMIARALNLGWLSWLIALGGVLWLANDIPPFLLVASRTFFAMAFDRMMPEQFSYVSERWHAPTWSIIITAVAGTLGCVAESNIGGLGTYTAFAGVIGTDIFDAFFLTLFCASCMLLPLERRDIHDRAAVKHSVGAVVGLGFVATLLAGYCLYIFVKESAGWIFTPQTVGDISSSVGFFICIILGLLFYIYYMYKNTTRGIDVRTIYMNIPPE